MWTSVWACVMNGGSVPRELINSMMGSRSWKVLLWDFSSLNMHFEWSTGVWTLLTGVGFNQMLISLIIMNVACDSTSCGPEKCFGCLHLPVKQSLVLLLKLWTAVIIGTQISLTAPLLYYAQTWRTHSEPQRPSQLHRIVNVADVLTCLGPPASDQFCDVKAGSGRSARPLPTVWPHYNRHMFSTTCISLSAGSLTTGCGIRRNRTDDWMDSCLITALVCNHFGLLLLWQWSNFNCQQKNNYYIQLKFVTLLLFILTTGNKKKRNA